MTNAKILRMTKLENKGPVQAFFTVAVGDFEIEGLRLIKGKNGLFLGLPSRSYLDRKANETKYVDIVKITSKKLLAELLELATTEYERRDGAPTTTKKKVAALSLDDVETPTEEENDDDLPF
jgi:DNA-binding cell septation regulator SpoVG